jgi:hypothetical protein
MPGHFSKHERISMRKFIRDVSLVAVTAFTALPVFADLSGAYGRANADGSTTTYLVVVQRGNSILVTLNSLGIPLPALFGGTTPTNVFGYGIAQVDPVSLTATVRVTNYNGACYTDEHLQFIGGSIVRTGVGGTCTPSSFTDTFNLAF